MSFFISVVFHFDFESETVDLITIVPGNSLLFIFNHHYMSLVVRKPVFGVSDQVGHKSGCRHTEDG